jgi:hypothetical protein
MRLFFLVALATSFLSGATPPPVTDLDWSHYVRIAGHGLSKQSVAAIIADAQKSHIFGIEVDNDPPGRYESFLDPRAKLEAIRQAANAAHAIGNKAFVYIAGLECITANADASTHSFFKDHPDWVQRKRDGKPAVFGGGTAFWITKGDEDVWISPYAPEWRSRYMEIVRQIAATGIDGIYVDIPYWMTHFEGWEDSWASFDKYTVAAFRRETGLDALHDLRLGDTSDPHFRRWIDFRIKTITEFMADIRKNVRLGNPKCLTIAEIYPGIEDAAPRVGSDVYQLYPVVDAIAHEYHGPEEGMAASRSVFDWISQMIGIYAFRAFAEDKATWMLDYSWDGEKGVSIPESMKTLFASQLTTGANTWDAKGHVMSGSNDLAVRTQAFAWIAKHQHTFYDPRLPVSPVGVYFSPSTRNYNPKQYVPRFRAAMEALLFSHREFQIVTPRSLPAFKGQYLLIPGDNLLDQAERNTIASKLPNNKPRIDPDKSLDNFDDRVKAWLPANAERVEDRTSIDSQVSSLLNQIPDTGEIQIHASPFVVSQTARVNGKVHVFLMNFKGVVPKRNPAPQPNTDTTIELPPSAGHVRAFMLPYLGQASEVPLTAAADKLRLKVPSFQRSAVIWFEPVKP